LKATQKLPLCIPNSFCDAWITLSSSSSLGITTSFIFKF
jgi:hypothetical protein